MRYIRWQGAIAFIVISALILGILLLASGPVAKMLIEKYGAEYTGAEVNVEKVSVALMPLTLTIDGLQATDPKKPSNNMVSFNQALASVEFWPLIFGKTIIDQLTVESLAFGQTRASIGEVYRQPEETDDAGQSFNWLDDIQQNLPSPKELLANANLKTVKRAQAFEQTYQQQRTDFKNIKQQLPDAEKLKSYEKRVEALADVKVKTLEDLEKIKTEFDQLKQEFKKDKAQVKSVQEQVVAAKHQITEELTALKNAPSEDWQDISSKYQLDTIESEDFAHLLFGEKAREYYQWADIIFEHVKPLINNKSGEEPTSAPVDSGSKGRFVYFDEENPTPSFWLKKADISMAQGEATYIANLTNITHQHWLIGQRSTVKVAADNKANIGAVKLNSDFAFDSNQLLSANSDWNVAEFPLNNIEIQQSSKFNLNLVSALLKVAGNMSIDQGQLSFNSDFALMKNQFTGGAESKLANVLIDTLKNTPSLSMDLSATGNWLSPSWQLSSDLNGLLAGAFKQQASAKLTEFKQKLQVGLNAKLGDSLSLAEGEYAQLLDLETLISDSDKALENLANSDVVKQQKKRLEEKAKDKLKDKLGKLFGN
ncbi:TIGR03545 family protein [Colwellia sp. MEBiC06753]